MADNGGMYIVTNREIRPEKRGFAKFGKEPNARGPNTLRMVQVLKIDRKWRIELLPDSVDRKVKVDGETTTVTESGSKVAARTVFQRLTSQPKTGPKKDLLLFVHGFNNDVEAVVERAWNLQRLYNLEVVAFSWPANGGGA